MTEPTALRVEYVKRVKAELAAMGYVVLKEASYLKAQERQRIARVMEAHAVEDAERAREWARKCCDEERRLRDRLTYVYGVAMAHGATTEELHGCEQCKSYADTIAELRVPLNGGSTPEPDSVLAQSAPALPPITPCSYCGVASMHICSDAVR